MYVFVSDMFVQDYVGGAELTSDAIMKKTRIPVGFLHSKDITPQAVTQLKDRHWIFGNFSDMSDDMILYCCKNLNYSIIEYDYKYCEYRLPEKHMTITGECSCEHSTRGKLVSVFYANAKNLWFMSENQKQFYCEKFPFLDKPTTHVLSSVFCDETLGYIESLSVDDKNDTWLIQNSDSWVKGTPDAVGYAEENNLKYEMFSGIKYPEMLKKFSKSKGFVFLPRSLDTCPRTVIEAKLLGCELKLNQNVQHKDEKWFAGDKEDTLSYLKTRVDFFWDEVMASTEPPVPQRQKNVDEQTHFKVVIPVYNSDKWIYKSIKSVLDQEYENYECIVSDDISTDRTHEFASSLDSPKLSVFKNEEKKYALKNIYDSIKRSNPKPEDVIVVLDGDDWLTNNHVLSKLNEYYSKEGCLVTYGSFVQFPQGSVGQEASEYPKEVIERNTYRSDRWRASHLKTFKYSVWSKVEEEDLKDTNGSFYEISYDQAMMLPLLEMAREKAKYIPEVLCVYNTGNPNAVNKTRAEKQHKTMLEIRKKSSYDRIRNEDLS
jgi:hypothetical protein